MVLTSRARAATCSPAWAANGAWDVWRACLRRVRPVCGEAYADVRARKHLSMRVTACAVCAQQTWRSGPRRSDASRFAPRRVGGLRRPGDGARAVRAWAMETLHQANTVSNARKSSAKTSAWLFATLVHMYPRGWASPCANCKCGSASKPLHACRCTLVRTQPPQHAWPVTLSTVAGHGGLAVLTALPSPACSPPTSGQSRARKSTRMIRRTCSLLARGCTGRARKSKQKEQPRTDTLRPRAVPWRCARRDSNPQSQP